MESGAPPDIASAMSGADNGNAREKDHNASTTPPGSSSLFPGMGGDSSGTAGIPGTIPGQSAGGQPTLPPGTPPPTVNWRESLQMLNPAQAFSDAWHRSISGEKTSEQQKVEQTQQQRLAARIAAAQQDWESYKQQRKLEDKRRIDAIIQMKSQLSMVAGRLRGSSIGFATTTQGDLSEIQLLEKALRDAQEQKKREQAQAQMRAQQSHTPKKGPQLEGAEAGGGQVSMMDRMNSGAETKRSAKEDKDAMQRQSEQALGE